MESEKITKALQGAEEGGITNLLALRGDPPKGEEKWEATEGGFTCALDLVRHIKKTCGDKFGLSVAGYPEGHPNVIKKVRVCLLSSARWRVYLAMRCVVQRASARRGLLGRWRTRAA